MGCDKTYVSSTKQPWLAFLDSGLKGGLKGVGLLFVIIFCSPRLP